MKTLKFKKISVDGLAMSSPASYPGNGMYFVNEVSLVAVRGGEVLYVGNMYAGLEKHIQYEDDAPTCYSTSTVTETLSAPSPEPCLTANDLLKAIAISQKPELAKDLLS